MRGFSVDKGFIIAETNRRPNHDEAPRIIETIPVAGELSPSHCDNYIRRGHYYPGLNVTAQMRRFGEEHERELYITFDLKLLDNETFHQP